MPKAKTKKPTAAKLASVLKAPVVIKPIINKPVSQGSFWMPILLTIATVMLLASCGIFMTARVQLRDRAVAYQFVLNQATNQDAIVKAQVQSAISMLDGIYAKVVAGEMKEDEAKKLGADMLRNLSYGKDGKGYFFADTNEGVNVVLPTNPSVEGTNRIAAQVNGVYHVREIIKAGLRPGGGFTNYYFVKPGGDKPLAKRAYSLEFKPFGWVVGTGYYLEDVISNNYNNGWKTSASCGFGRRGMMNWW